MMRIFIGRDDARRNRFQERLGQRFLEGDFFVEERVFEDRRDVFRQEHQVFEIVIIETAVR